MGKLVIGFPAEAEKKWPNSCFRKPDGLAAPVEISLLPSFFRRFLFSVARRWKEIFA